MTLLAPGAANASPTILIAEDEPIIRNMTREYLEAVGFHVVAAADAQEALRVIQSDPSIKLVFTDIQMPGSFDGNELCLWIAANHPRLPVLLTSGLPAPSCADRGIHRFIPKPYDLAQIESEIESLLQVAVA